MAVRLTRTALIVRTPEEADALMAKVLQSASQTCAWLRDQPDEPLALLHALKFTTAGFHPVDGHALNFIEQINQTWPFATAIAASRWLLTAHPEAGGFVLAPGASATQDLDIMSVNEGLVGAETCAVTRPTSNQKLAKDLKKLSARPERHRYAFMMCPLYPSTARLPKLERDGVQVWSIHV
jgi:hypothetical protein